MRQSLSLCIVDRNLTANTSTSRWDPVKWRLMRFLGRAAGVTGGVGRRDGRSRWRRRDRRQTRHGRRPQEDGTLARSPRPDNIVCRRNPSSQLEHGPAGRTVVSRRVLSFHVGFARVSQRRLSSDTYFASIQSNTHIVWNLELYFT